ncbi:MAG: Fe-S cluster assembly scaffold protein NifU [Candidatus Aminicenantes bacterium]|nr:Fe-S cluster assembly scaffold protein NifU [Candidatus Aminicenantes bacterium]
MYTDKVMDHFQNPRNVGVLKDADGVGKVGNPVCGDMMTFYIKVKDQKLEDVKFQTFGCGAAIAVSSIVSEMAKGMTLEEAMKLTNDRVAEELGGLPKNKLHCSNLGADALHKAIENYRTRQGEDPAVEKKKGRGGICCPYCDGPLEGAEGLCRSCHVKLMECPACHKITKAGEDTCSHCGARLSST